LALRTCPRYGFTIGRATITPSRRLDQSPNEADDIWSLTALCRRHPQLCLVPWSLGSLPRLTSLGPRHNAQKGPGVGVLPAAFIATALAEPDRNHKVNRGDSNTNRRHHRSANRHSRPALRRDGVWGFGQHAQSQCWPLARGVVIRCGRQPPAPVSASDRRDSQNVGLYRDDNEPIPLFSEWSFLPSPPTFSALL